MEVGIIKVTDFTVEAVPRKVIAGFVEKHHYLHSVNGVQHIQCFGLFKEGKFGFDKQPTQVITNFDLYVLFVSVYVYQIFSCSLYSTFITFLYKPE